MGEHKKASKSSNDVMGHLHFVLLSRLDLSKRLIDRIEVKISSFTSKTVNMYSNYSLYFSLANELYGEGFIEMDRDIDAFMTTSIKKVKKVFCSEEQKKRQKFSYDCAVFLGRDSTWSRNSSNAFFKLFTYTELFIKYLDTVGHLMDGYVEDIHGKSQILQMISETSSQISAQEEDNEIDDDDDNDGEESKGDDDEEESVEDEDEEVDDDGVDGNGNDD